MSGRAREPGRTVTSRLAAVLGAFAVDHEELTLTEVSRRSGLALATTRRLLLELAREKLVERVPSGNYRVGLRLWEIGSHSIRRNVLRRVAIPAIRDLYNATLDNVLLAAPDAGQVLYLERISGDRSAPSRTAVGSRWPLHASAVGKVFLAFMAEADARRALTGPLSQLTADTVAQPGLLWRSLAKVRGTGIAFSYGEDEVGLIGVAAPIFDRVRPEAVAALALVGPWQPRRMQRLATAVGRAADSISTQLQAEMESA